MKARGVWPVAGSWGTVGGWNRPWPSSEKRSEEHTSELQSHSDLVCRLLLEKKNLTTGWSESTAFTTSATNRWAASPNNANLALDNSFSSTAPRTSCTQRFFSTKIPNTLNLT